MAIAHVCPQCGRDLARRRPQLEPHYNLRLIFCECGWATTRPMHPILRSWRQILRLYQSLTTLSGQLMAIAAIATTNVFAATWIAATWMKDDNIHDVLQWRFWLLWPLLVVPVVTGSWLSAALSHWRYLSQWLAWAAFITLIMTFIFLIIPRVYAMQYRAGIRLVPPGPTAGLSAMWTRSLLVFAAMMFISLIGVPLGSAIRVAYGHRRINRWKRRRRRLRARGLST
jgi:hypothetical protein